MKNSIQIRSYQEKDSKVLYQLFYDTVHYINIKDYNQEQISLWAPEIHDKDMNQWSYGFKNNISIVAEDMLKNVLVGFCDMEMNGYINRSYVHKDYQGQGIGGFLLKTIENKAKELGIDKVFSHVSITAKPFFESKGFKLIKQQVVMIRDVEFINFVMEKVVS